MIIIYTKEQIEKLPTRIKSKYLATYLPNHHRANDGYVYIHILMMECKLGSELKPKEEVHHLDGDKFNNSFDNLICFKNRSEHIRYHASKFKAKLIYDEIEDNYSCEIKHYCENCGKELTSKHKMCMDCYNKNKSKNIPPKEHLIDLIKIFPFTYIGELYGVSDNAVRRWCKKYDIPFKRKDIKNI